MAAIPKKVAERLVVGLKRYQPILAAAIARDVGEADTVTIIKDMLADVFGYLWCKEGWQRSMLGEYHAQKQALSRFSIDAMVQTDVVLDVIRREIRRITPDVRIDPSQIKAVLINEVIKRDVLEGEKADEARKKVT
jgi:hypothetical protein